MGFWMIRIIATLPIFLNWPELAIMCIVVVYVDDVGRVVVDDVGGVVVDDVGGVALW